MAKEIFRTASLDRLSSPEQLDQLLQVTTTKGWAALLALCGVLGAFITWGFLGSTTTKVDGEGVIVRTGGVFNIVALAAGRVTSLRVKVDDVVQANQVVAIVAQPELYLRVRDAKDQLALARAAIDRVLASRKQGDVLKTGALDQQKANVALAIRDTEEQIKLIKDQIPVDEELLTKGLITKQATIETKQKLVAAEANIEKLRAQGSELGSQQYSLQHETVQTSIQGQNSLRDMERNVAALEQQLDRATKVISPHSGQVVEVKVAEGAIVGAGYPIIAIEPAVKKLEAIVYAPSSQGKEIRPGMPVQISPSGVQREEYGFMLGKVSSISEFPATEEAIVRNFQNDTLARSLMASGPVSEVRVEFFVDPHTTSGFKWSSPKGPPQTISSGAVCNAEVVTREQPPIELVIPYFKKKLGLS